MGREGHDKLNTLTEEIGPHWLRRGTWALSPTGPSWEDGPQSGPTHHVSTTTRHHGHGENSPAGPKWEHAEGGTPCGDPMQRHFISPHKCDKQYVHNIHKTRNKIINTSRNKKSDATCYFSLPKNAVMPDAFSFVPVHVSRLHWTAWVTHGTSSYQVHQAMQPEQACDGAAGIWQPQTLDRMSPRYSQPGCCWGYV